MSLKSLINALFKLSGSQAMPKAGWTDLDSSASQITATSDGWLQFRVDTADAEHPWFWVKTDNRLAVNLNASSFVGGGAEVFLPVKKGDVISFQLNKCTVAHKRMHALVGGGVVKLISELLSTIFSKEVAYA